MSVSHINQLHPEVLSEIFVGLDTSSYLKARQVCQLWREICLQRNVESHQISKIWGLLGMGQYATVQRIAAGEISMNVGDTKRICDLVVGGGENGAKQRFIYSQQQAALQFTGPRFRDIVTMFFQERHIRARPISDVCRNELGRKLISSPDGTKVMFANKRRMFMGDLLVLDIKRNRLDGWVEVERSLKNKLIDAPEINLDTIDESMICLATDNLSFALLDESRHKVRIFPLKDVSRKCKCLAQKKCAQFKLEFPSTGIQLSSNARMLMVSYRMWDSLYDVGTGSVINIHSYPSQRPHCWRPSTIHESHAVLTIPFGSNHTIVLGRCEQWSLSALLAGLTETDKDDSKGKHKSGSKNSTNTRSLMWQYFQYLLSGKHFICVRLCAVEPVASESCFLGFSPYHRQRFLTPVVVRIEEYTRLMPSFDWFVANINKDPAIHATSHDTEFSFPKDMELYTPSLDILQLMPLLYGQHMRVSLSADTKRLAIRVSNKKIYLYNLDDASLVRVFNGPRPLAIPFKTISNFSSPSLLEASFEGEFHLLGNEGLYVGLESTGQAMIFELNGNGLCGKEYADSDHILFPPLPSVHKQGDRSLSYDVSSSQEHHYHHILSHLRRRKSV